MGYYNASELKNKMAGGKTRELNVKNNEQKQLWMPKAEFFYQRRHFEFHDIPGVVTHRKCCFCCNTDYGVDNGGCMVCNHIQEMWKKWRSADSTEAKKSIQDYINRLTSEYFYINVLDVLDPEQKFVAMRLTPSKAKEMLIVIENNPIENIKWLYKKSVTPIAGGRDKTTYTLTELINDKEALLLRDHMDDLVARPYDMGGLIDLEAAYGKTQTAEELTTFLTTGGGDHEDDEHESDAGKPAVDKTKTATLASLSKPKSSTTVTNVPAPATLTAAQKATPKDIPIDMDEGLSLDDLSLDDSLSLDDLSLDTASAVVMVPLAVDFVKTNANDKPKMLPIIEYFTEQKIVVATGNYNVDIKAVFAYIKSNVVNVPDSLINDMVVL